MRKYLASIFPSLTVTISFLVLPIVLCVYFVVSQYSNRFIVEQDISYTEVQHNWLGRLFIDQSWLEWFNRFMDFAFWGALAFVILVGIWAFSSAKIAFKNHYAQEGFTNFSTDKTTWHRHFFVVFGLKVILVVLALYCVLSLIGKQVPQLSLDINTALQGATLENIKPALLTCVVIFGYQFLFVTCIKVFRHLQAQ